MNKAEITSWRNTGSCCNPEYVFIPQVPVFTEGNFKPIFKNVSVIVVIYQCSYIYMLNFEPFSHVVF